MVWVGKLKCVKSNSCEFKAWQADFFEHDFNFLANYCNNSRSRTVWQGLAPTVEPEQQFSFSIHYFLRFQSKVKECFSWQFVLHTNKYIILSHLRKWRATGFLPVSISKWHCCWRDCGEDKWIISVFPLGNKRQHGTKVTSITELAVRDSLLFPGSSYRNESEVYKESIWTKMALLSYSHYIVQSTCIIHSMSRQKEIVRAFKKQPACVPTVKFGCH